MLDYLHTRHDRRHSTAYRPRAETPKNVNDSNLINDSSKSKGSWHERKLGPVIVGDKHEQVESVMEGREHHNTNTTPSATPTTLSHGEQPSWRSRSACPRLIVVPASTWPCHGRQRGGLEALAVHDRGGRGPTRRTYSFLLRDPHTSAGRSRATRGWSRRSTRGVSACLSWECLRPVRGWGSGL